MATQHPTMPAPARRGLLAGAAALVAGAPALAAAQSRAPVLDADARLLAALAELRAASDHLIELEALDGAPEEGAAETDLDRAALRLRRAHETVADIPARTMAGLGAKAAAAIRVMESYIPVTLGSTVEDEADDHEWLSWRLAHDVLRHTGAEPWPPRPQGTAPDHDQRPAAFVPPMVAEWEAEGAKLAAEGLERRHGLTHGDMEAIAWLVRRVRADLGDDIAARVAALAVVA